MIHLERLGTACMSATRRSLHVSGLTGWAHLRTCTSDPMGPGAGLHHVDSDLEAWAFMGGGDGDHRACHPRTRGCAAGAGHRTQAVTKRACTTPGCGALTNGGHCPKHRRERDRARGTRQQRGYDAEHDAERRRWAPIVATGGVRCRRCPKLIGPDEPWDLGHPDADCPRPRAPEHIACNRATAGRSR